MYIAKHMCMVQGKMYQMADEWKGQGEPPLKYFSLARERIKVRPTPLPVVEELPITIPAPYEAPPPPVKPLTEMDYYELIDYGKTLGILVRYKKPALIKLIQEKLNANPN